MKKLITLLFFFSLTFVVTAQIDLKEKLKGYTNPEELVTLSESISFDQAIEVLSKVSLKISGKNIVSTVSDANPIGVEINKMPYKKALLIIIQYRNLIWEETATTIIIKKKEAAERKGDSSYVSIDEKEVKISAVLFEANISEMDQKGINWQFLLSQTGLSIGGKLVSIKDVGTSSSSTTTTTTTGTQQTQITPDFNLTANSSYSMGPFDGTATALLKFFEEENLGKVISRPVITAINGKTGKTQVGTDFSIKEKDFSGNLTDKFYKSGTIIEATPRILTDGGINYVYLTIRLEKSTVVLGGTSTLLPKTEVSTNLLLLDGEETAIGGLITNEETTVRRGIPLLKDLPWWVLGLRYVFGYDEVDVTRKEMILLIKADIIPSLKERFNKSKDQTLLKQTIEKERGELEKYIEQTKKKEEEIK